MHSRKKKRFYLGYIYERKTYGRLSVKMRLKVYKNRIERLNDCFETFLHKKPFLHKLYFPLLKFSFFNQKAAVTISDVLAISCFLQIVEIMAKICKSENFSALYDAVKKNC